MRNALRRHPWRIVVVLGATTLPSVGFLGLQALGVVGGKTVNAPIDRVSGVDATDSQSTTSTTYVDMPSMSTTFTLAGPNKKKVAVLFEGEIDASLPATDVSFQFVVDGTVQSGPQPLLAHQVTHQTNGFNFISDLLSPGVHTAKIQWKTGSGVSVTVTSRSLLVLFDS